MPRTAITTALKHGRKESVLLFGKEVSLLDQKKSFLSFKAPPHVHKDYCEVSYQESDSPEQKVRLMSEIEHKEHTALRQSESDKMAAWQKNQRESAKPKAPKPPTRNSKSAQKPAQAPATGKQTQGITPAPEA